MKFPQYRKIEGFQRFYRITDDMHFTEVYSLNGKLVTHNVTAEQYPEMLRIKDMLACEFSFREMSAEEADEVFGT